MKKISYTGKEKKDLIKALMEKRESLRKLKFGHSGSKTRNVKSDMTTRREIARIMTELNKVK